MAMVGSFLSARSLLPARRRTMGPLPRGDVQPAGGGLVTLSEKHRGVLYEHFVSLGGEEVAEAFIAEFPGGDGDEPISRDFLRAELGELRGDLRREIADLRAELLVKLPSILAGPHGLA